MIEDPGLSSDGLTLSIRPRVSDPDGDEVTLRVEVGGDEIPVAGDPPSQPAAEVRFDVEEVGYAPTATVVILATDSQGAATSATFTHDLAATTTVTVREVTFRLQAPALCFAETAARRLTGGLRLLGAVALDAEIDTELRADLSTVVLLDEATGTVSGKATTQRISVLNARIAGEGDALTFSHSGSVSKLHRMFEGTPCRGYLSYKIDFVVR